jgi:tRNA(fMet)-specific endonuclease VapC
MQSSSESFAVTIVSVEEMMRGSLSLIHRRRDPQAQIPPYAKLQRWIASLAKWQVLPWDMDAADRMASLRSQKIRVGSMDLKIAAVALVHGSILLTRNARDFELVPGLTIEDWLG